MIYEKSEPPWRLVIQLILKFGNTPYLPNGILEPSSDISLSKSLIAVGLILQKFHNALLF